MYVRNEAKKKINTWENLYTRRDKRRILSRFFFLVSKCHIENMYVSLAHSLSSAQWEYDYYVKWWLEEWERRRRLDKQSQEKLESKCILNEGEHNILFLSIFAYYSINIFISTSSEEFCFLTLSTQQWIVNLKGNFLNIIKGVLLWLKKSSSGIKVNFFYQINWQHFQIIYME